MREKHFLDLLDGRIRQQVSLFSKGGRAVLDAIRRQNYDTLSHRPSLSKWQKGTLIARAMLAMMASKLGGGRRMSMAGRSNRCPADHLACALARVLRATHPRKARNFYYGLKLLPEGKRAAMFAVYAWMRLVDDIADEEDGRGLDQRVADLEAWRLRTHAVLDGHDDGGGLELWPAFAEVIRRYNVPPKLFDAVIEGQKQDLDFQPFDNFEQLFAYCYRVAGVVGLASIHIWGFEGGDETEFLAVQRGAAFQLTNILRDLREDAFRGRIYLPREELAMMSVSEDDLRQGRGGRHFLDLMRFQIARAEAFYENPPASRRESTPTAGRRSSP